MTWFFVDDNFPQHPKVLAIPRRDRAGAIGLWTLAGAWSSKHLTDGRIPPHLPVELGCTKRQAKALVDARAVPDEPGLWLPDSGGGWLFHDWEQWQETRDEVVAKRASRSEAGRRGGIRSGQSRRSKVEASASGLLEANSEANANGIEPRPVPSRPVPSVVEVASKSSLADARAKIDDYHLDLIAHAARGDRVWAEEVITLILAGRDDVTNPAKYVLTAVNANPDRYRPTPTPEPYRSSPSFGMPA